MLALAAKLLRKAPELRFGDQMRMQKP